MQTTRENLATRPRNGVECYLPTSRPFGRAVRALFRHFTNPAKTQFERGRLGGRHVSIRSPKIKISRVRKNGEASNKTAHFSYRFGCRTGRIVKRTTKE